MASASLPSNLNPISRSWSNGMSLSSAARIIDLEERLAEAERRCHEMELAHAVSSNAVIHTLEADLERAINERDVAVERASQLAGSLANMVEQRRREALVRQAAEARDLETEERHLDQQEEDEEQQESSSPGSTHSNDLAVASGSAPPEPHELPSPSPLLKPTNGSFPTEFALGQPEPDTTALSSANSSTATTAVTRTFGSVRRALRRSRDAVKLSLPRVDSSQSMSPRSSPRSSRDDL